MDKTTKKILGKFLAFVYISSFVSASAIWIMGIHRLWILGTATLMALIALITRVALLKIRWEVFEMINLGAALAAIMFILMAVVNTPISAIIVVIIMSFLSSLSCIRSSNRS